MSVQENRVLSIQSHVVSGYVGNKSAVFPMQVLGYEVDFINSVQLSNHTGYGHFPGQVLDASNLRELYDGLKFNKIHRYSHVLTGYVGSKSFLMELVDIVKDLKAVNPGLVFVCDPVMGDDGVFYVPQELLPIYRDQLLPLADIITPNQFEAELLSEMKIRSEADALVAMEKLHQKGVKTVVISSTELGSSHTLLLLGSTTTGDSKKCIRMEYPRLDAHFTGTGDLFTSLLLVWTNKYPQQLELACEKTVATMQAVLQRTLKSAQELAGAGNTPTSAQIELRMVQSRKDIESPGNSLKATILPSAN